MALPNVFLDSPLFPLGIGSPIEEVIGSVNWLIADFNERHKEDAAPESSELAATDSQQPQLEMPCESDFMAWCAIQHYNQADAVSIYRYIARHIKRVR